MCFVDHIVEKKSFLTPYLLKGVGYAQLMGWKMINPLWNSKGN